MRKVCTLMLIVFGLLLVQAQDAFAANRYIVRFEKEAVKSTDREVIIRSAQENVAKHLKAITSVTKSPKSLKATPLWIINGAAITANENEIERIKNQKGVKEVFKSEYKIWLEKDIDKKKATLKEGEIEWNIKKINADKVWADYNINGAGVVVGILDTGIDGKHPAFTGKILKFKDFTPDNKIEPHDGQGHGSHTAGTVCGDLGVGVAPGARLIVGKIFDTKGGTTSDILLAGMQWVMDPDGDPATNDGPRLISNSWGSNDSTNKTFWAAVQSWVDAKILPVFAAGNNGMWGGKVGTPAAFPHSWAVAATTKTDTLAYFSSQGPVAWDGVQLMKPDIAAPGHQIVSCAIGGGMVSNSGTSMACPAVSGVAALMYQADPTLTLEQIRLIGEETALDLGTAGKDGKFGSGLIDAHKMVTRALENVELASVYASYESIISAEKALVGIQAVSPLAAPLAKSIIIRTSKLDDGQFNALVLKVNASNNSAAKALLKEAKALRVANELHK